MPDTGGYPAFVATIEVDHPLAQDLLSKLRDETTPPALFRTLSRTLATVLMLEATRDLPTVDEEVWTPLEKTTGRRLDDSIVVVPVLRAGLGLLDAAIDLFPTVRVGYIGLERDEATFETRRYYAKLPRLAGTRTFVLDPMLATGGSAASAIDELKNAGAGWIRMVSVVAAPEGVRRLDEAHPDVDVVTASVDRELNDSAYILPGLGDFGDRLFGTDS